MATPPSLWTERYEALRRHALEGGLIFGTDPLGLVLLARQGVAGWMQRWAQGVECTVRPLGSPSGPRCPPPPFWQSQLTVLLAQMTAAHLQPVSRP